jgi:hypothetical protein
VARTLKPWRARALHFSGPSIALRELFESVAPKVRQRGAQIAIDLHLDLRVPRLVETLEQLELGALWAR